MRIRGKVSIRNYDLISARKKLGLSQGKLAQKTGMPISVVIELECLNYRGKKKLDYAIALSTFLKLDLQKIMPDDLVGVELKSTNQQVKEMSSVQISEMFNSEIVKISQERNILPSPENELMNEELREKIEKCLNELPERRKQVLIYRYGLCGERIHTLDEVGEKFGVGGQRARAIEMDAISKLQRCGRANILKPFVEDQYE